MLNKTNPDNKNKEKLKPNQVKQSKENLSSSEWNGEWTGHFDKKKTLKSYKTLDPRSVKK